ncbi:MAG: hypothetical protein VYD57_18695 [Pseudomonadota bacterium]|nr:hypothetical protein [Pseudomonadota bacterium]
MHYSVSYSTPTTADGSAVVEADGIFAAHDETRAVVHILTGHPPKAILVTAVAEYPDGRILWTSEPLEAPHVGAHR